MIKTKLYELNLGDLPYFEVCPEWIPFIKVWNGKEWHPGDDNITTTRIHVPLTEVYYATELDEKHMHITQPKEGELFIVHSSVVGVFDVVEDEWYYQFGWSALWLMSPNLYLWGRNKLEVNPSLQYAIQGLPVDFEDALDPGPDLTFSL